MMKITGSVEYTLTVNQTDVHDQCVHHPGWFTLLFCSFFSQQFTCIKIITPRDSTSLGLGWIHVVYIIDCFPNIHSSLCLIYK